jgi:hypothetical protein
MQAQLVYSPPVLRMQNSPVRQSRDGGYRSDIFASQAAAVKEWVVIVVALGLAIVWYGSLTGFCLAVCGGWGHVASCEAQWGVWAKAVCR